MPVYIGSGALSTRDCTRNATLTIVGDAAGMNLVTYFNITASAFGFVAVTGTLNLAAARQATLTAVAIIRPTTVASLDFVTYGKLVPGETTKTVTDGRMMCATLDSIWISLLPPRMSGTGSTKGEYGTASTGGTDRIRASARLYSPWCRLWRHLACGGAWSVVQAALPGSVFEHSVRTGHDNDWRRVQVPCRSGAFYPSHH